VYLLATSGDFHSTSRESRTSPKVLTATLRQSESHLQNTQQGTAGLPDGVRSSRAEHTGPAGRIEEEAPVLAVAQPSGPYYFRMTELTQKPVLLHDAVAGLVLRVPGLPPQPVILRLLISDEGEIDRVVVEDSFLAGDIERYVTEAFSKVRFQPGKIGRIPVRSQLRVEARLESMEYRLPDTLGSRIGISKAQAQPS
jgi:hypothetical protein